MNARSDESPRRAAASPRRTADHIKPSGGARAGKPRGCAPQRWGLLPDARPPRRPQHTASDSPQHIETLMFIDHRPISAVLAALATSTVFVVLDLLLRYAAR